MFKQNVFASHAASVAILALGAVFSTTSLNAATAGSGASRVKASTSPGESFVDTWRAYPPSCFSNGLPFGQASNYPNAITSPIDLYAYSTTAASGTGGDITETGDSVSVWRVPCSGGVSAVVVEMDRPSALDGSTTQYPEFPEIYITSTPTSTTLIYPRIAGEPNTLFEKTEAESYFYFSTIYVLEYYNPADPAIPSGAATTSTVNYNQAFTLQINNNAGGTNLIINVPAYVPPTNPAMPISGYMSTNWSNPNQSGEGMLLQVYDNGDGLTRTLSFAWFTYDDLGSPFWLYGQGSFDIGATTVTAPTVYFEGGTFAPLSPSPAVGYKPWGNITFTFPDCGHMNITYSGDASAVQGPVASGASATFQRVADLNSLTCQ